MPFGYCIDPRSLREDFALAARCDRLWGQGPFAGLALAVITITATPLPPGGQQPGMASLMAGLGGAETLHEQMSGTQPLILARGGTPPSPGLSATHWMSVFTAGGQVVALSLYARKTARPCEAREQPFSAIWRLARGWQRPHLYPAGNGAATTRCSG